MTHLLPEDLVKVLYYLEITQRATQYLQATQIELAPGDTYEIELEVGALMTQEQVNAQSVGDFIFYPNLMQLEIDPLVESIQVQFTYYPPFKARDFTFYNHTMIEQVPPFFMPHTRVKITLTGGSDTSYINWFSVGDILNWKQYGVLFANMVPQFLVDLLEKVDTQTGGITPNQLEQWRTFLNGDGAGGH